MLRIELPLFLIFFSFMLADPVFTNLLIFRTCYVTLGYNVSDCALLGMRNATEKTAELERLVQPHANMVSMTQNTLDSVIMSVVCAFFGPWSDKHGRKPLFLTCLIGFTLNYLLYTFLSYFQYSSPWLFLIGLAFSFCGGFACYLSATFSFITDVTSEDNRGARMGTAEAAMVLGTFTGTISSSYLLEALDYYYSFGICALVAFCATLYTLFALPESVEVQESNNRFKDLFTINHIKDMFQVVFKQREQSRRTILLLALIMMGGFMFVVNDTTVQFYYLRRAFAWSLERFTIFQAISQCLWVVGTIFVVYVLHKLLKIPESVLLLVGFLSLLDSYLIYGLASKSWHIYGGGAIRMLGGGVSPLTRTLMSKLVDSNEIGKVFSFLMPVETLLGIVVYPIYTLVYNSTINTAPSTYNFVTAGVIGVEIVMVLAVIHLQRRSNNINYLNLQADVTI